MNCTIVLLWSKSPQNCC